MSSPYFRHADRAGSSPRRLMNVAMKKNTQRIIAGLLVFLMIATLLVGIFANTNSSSGSLPAPGASASPLI